MKTTIFEDLLAIQNGESLEHLKKIKQILDTEEDNVELAYQLSISMGYSPFQTIAITRFLKSDWGFKTRLQADFFESLETYPKAILSAVQFVVLSREAVDAQKDIVAISIQNIVRDMQTYYGNQGMINEIIGLNTSDYLGFICILDGIPFLIFSERIKSVLDSDKWRYDLDTLAVCILPEIPQNLIQLPSVEVELNIRAMETPFSPLNFHLYHAKNDGSETTSLDFFFDYSETHGYQLVVEFFSPKTDYDKHQLFNFSLSNNILSEPFINKDLLLSIANEKSIKALKTRLSSAIEEEKALDWDLKLLYALLA